jgi:hypothetical protein
VSGPNPFLEFFKRGEVARDVRLLAAQGALAPRAHEQLGILVLLLDDSDPEIRDTARATLDRIPQASLSAFLGRSDVSLALREFFAERGVFPAEPTGEESAGEEPFVETSEASDEALLGADDSSDERKRESITQKLQKMSFTERLKAAVKGTREMRAILVRDTNKMIAAAVMSSPKLTEQEVEGISRMASVSEDVLRIIAHKRNWMKNYKIALGLAKNPKTPLAISMNLINRLNNQDLTQISIDRNVPEPLRIAARKKVVANRI